MLFSLTAFLLLCSSLLIVPSQIFSFTSYERAIGVSFLLVVYGLQLMLSKPHKNIFTLADIGWLSLIVLSFLSALWALNPYKAIYGGFTTLLVYLSYRLFQRIYWSSRFIISLRLLFFVCTVISLGMIANSQFQSSGVTYRMAGANVHYLGSFVMVMMPFILLLKKGIAQTVFSVLTLGALSFFIYKGGSLQVLLCVFITCLYLIVKGNKISLKKMMRVLFFMTLLSIVSVVIFKKNKTAITSKFTLLKEFDSQNDRLEMWKNSMRLFVKAPIAGVGKNNWKNEITQYGLGGYGRWKSENPGMFNHAHNWFFQIIAELGILGLLSYFLIFLSCIYSLAKSKKNTGFIYAALFALLSFIWLGLMYGIIYNQAERFQGLPILVALCLSIVNKGTKKCALDTSRFAGFIVITSSLLCLTFFYNSKLTSKKSTRVKALMHLGNYTTAVSTLDSLNEFWDNSTLFEQSAKANALLGNSVVARDYYRRVLDYDPYNVKLLYDYGSYLYKIGDFINAIDYSQRAYELSEGFLDNKLLMIDCLIEFGDKIEFRKLAIDLHSQMKRNLTKLRLKQNHKRKNRVISYKIQERITRYEEIVNKLEDILDSQNF